MSRSGDSKPKTLSKQAISGQRGVNTIESLVLSFGSKWNPTSALDVGIDGDIELCDPETGEALGLLIRVQSKAVTGPFLAETASSFEFVCDERDLDYWFKGNVPVILVVSRPASARPTGSQYATISPMLPCAAFAVSSSTKLRTYLTAWHYPDSSRLLLHGTLACTFRRSANPKRLSPVCWRCRALPLVCSWPPLLLARPNRYLQRCPVTPTPANGSSTTNRSCRSTICGTPSGTGFASAAA